ncbi:uncharacterized protein F5891DRAFT_1211427 [Suillus fuscotomentosus]|uniref:Uncharacterized protein n=1 Tax=Suillus fuscotomentosus TaxID=1912939 RepID=A0AAD4EBQ2_9AGAM|nr:uncharacterized protein F5891DRAFT_1211427 [Suillus fuscotomentosus]KAG1903231.1 hypothetical protein F5891DRAFT_1211427 [Suillus fuscotomentosus]
MNGNDGFGVLSILALFVEVWTSLEHSVRNMSSYFVLEYSTIPVKVFDMQHTVKSRTSLKWPVWAKVRANLKVSSLRVIGIPMWNSGSYFGPDVVPDWRYSGKNFNNSDVTGRKQEVIRGPPEVTLWHARQVSRRGGSAKLRARTVRPGASWWEVGGYSMSGAVPPSLNSAQLPLTIVEDLIVLHIES